MDAMSERLASGVQPARQLIEALAISPATLMRRVQRSGDQILRIGLGRATRYGLVQSWTGAASARLPLVRIDEAGMAVPAGQLVTLAARQTAWQPAGEVFNGLPVEVSDGSPSGYLGRVFAHQHTDLRLPPRISDWSDHHILAAVSRRGEDLPGNLIIGEESIDRWRNAQSVQTTVEDYPELADAVSGDQRIQSSAGGERPKFGTYADGRHVLVKFVAQAGPAGGATERWRDLLALEALALDVLREHGLPAARAQLLASDTYKFLEVERFDRVGERGRRSVVTLAALHQDPADSWARAAIRLQQARRIPAADARLLRLLDAFGALIGNVDRHHHNVVFFSTFSAPTDAEAVNYTLAPAFDQLPMLYAPGGDGSVPLRAFVLPLPDTETLDVWDEARSLALTFWRHASDGPTVSDQMRHIASDNARAISAG